MKFNHLNLHRFSKSKFVLLDLKGHLITGIPYTFTQAGRVYLFNLTSVNAAGTGIQNEAEFLSDKVVSTFSGDRDYGHFGMSLKFRDTNDDKFQDLIIGAPFRTEDFTEEITGGECFLIMQLIFSQFKDFRPSLEV